MPENKILLDSNSYFRLADNLYPLLSEKFGKNPVYKLCILSGTLGEYNYQKRLQSKFAWVDNQKHIDDRELLNFASDYEAKCISTLQLLKLMLDAGRISLQEIQDAVYMWDYMDDLPGNFYSDFKRLFEIKPVLYH